MTDNYLGRDSAVGYDIGLGRSVRVLMVEDHPPDAVYAEELLTSGGLDCTVEHAETLAAAVDLHARSAFDVILLDLHLPDSFGPASVTRLRALTADVPIVVMTRLTNDGAGVFEADADEFVAKGEITSPILERALRHAILRRRTLTDRRELQERLQAVQRLESLAPLTAGIAHEINNLLAVVAANVEMLLDGKVAPEGEPLAQEIQIATTRGANLVRRLLSFSSTRRLDVHVLDVIDLVNGLVETLRRVLPDGVHLRVDAGGGPRYVKGDPGALEQVLLSLAMNSVDALDGHPGSIVIEVSRAVLGPEDLERLDDVKEGPHVRISVRDDGPGMSPEVRAHAFEPFFSTKPAAEGSGLGLSTVYGIARQLGGSAEIHSEPGKGAEVTVHLPETEAPVHADVRPVQLELTPAPRTILVVEDEDAVRQATSMILREHGYQVLEADDGVTALEVVERHQGSIDLVLSDVIMPRMGGQRLYDEIQKLPVAVPVLFVSGFPAESLRSGDLLDPSLPLLSKPWRAAQLVEAVEAAVADGQKRRLDA